MQASSKECKKKNPGRARYRHSRRSGSEWRKIRTGKGDPPGAAGLYDVTRTLIGGASTTVGR